MTHSVSYRQVRVDGLNVFYRQAGPQDAPKVLLLHGFPSAGHMFRDLIPHLARDFNLVAPDLPGFGRSDMPGRSHFSYTFESLAAVMERFTTQIGFDRFAIYMFDFGAPTGFRLAVQHPERITGLISQSGNAYEEGFGGGWEAIRAYWHDPSTANRNVLRQLLQPQTTYWLYTHGVPDASRISPDGYSLDDYYLARPGADEVQLDLFKSYQSNIALYPSLHEYFRTRRPKLLAVWGKNDPIFQPAGAEAFKRDIPEARVRLLDTGHFALETHAAEIAQEIRALLLS